MTSILLATTLMASAVLASPPPVGVLSNGLLAPPHSDFGLDTDGDMLYNYLVVDVNISVSVPGIFMVNAMLFDPIGGSTIDIRNNFTMLPAGPQTVPIWFEGIAIRTSGIDGPYNVNIMLFNDTTIEDVGLHPTAPYLHTQFQTPPAAFWPPHLDFGEDTDGDLLFNYLVLDTVLNVTLAGPYSISADLFDNTGMLWITAANWGGFLGSGPQTVQLRFEGFLIFTSGIDGPYAIELTLRDDMGTFLDNDTHMTQSYLYTDFESSGGAELYPPYSDYGVDTDGDMLFNYLVIEIPLNVSEAALYEVGGTLSDSSGMFFISYQANRSTLFPGIWTLQLWFVGFEIRISGIDGPYLLDIVLRKSGMPIDTDIYMTNAYLSTDFDPAPGQFAPPHSDFGFDLDGDMLFDYLVVNVTLNISDPGMFSLFGDLYDNGMTNYIVSARNETPLAVGMQTVQLWFPGFVIRNSGIDGPYRASLSLSYEGIYLSSDLHLTGAYLYTDFETPPLYFTPPHSDHGLDTDGDMLFNYLVVEANVTVNMTGAYNFLAVLSDISGMMLIDFQFNTTVLAVGARSVGFNFDGRLIRSSGIDGPYRVDLQAQQGMSVVAVGFHITGAYTSDQFQMPEAEFGSPHSDFGLDTDVPPDGFFDFLVVNATVEVYRAGDFLLEGMLSHPMIPAGLIGVNFTHLDVGTQTVQLRFSGRDIYLSGASGTFDVMLLLVKLDPMGGTVLDFDFHTTGPYLNSEFQPANPGFLWGYVFDAGTGFPIPMAQVNVFNFTERSLKSATTDPTGYYSVVLHEGDFFVTADDPMHQSEGSLVYASGSTPLNMTLGAVPPGIGSTTLAFSGWDNLNATNSMSIQEDNQTLRPMVEILVGNGDGLLSHSEIEAFIAFMGSPPRMIDNTLDRFYVDGIHYDLVPGSDGFFANDGGAVWDDAPLTFNLVGDFVSNATIPVSLTHLLKVNVSYDTPSGETDIRANVPTGYLLQSYDPVPDVNVGGMGTSNIVVDPLVSPGAPLPYVWVNLTVARSSDSTAPDIMAVLMDGQPSVTFYLSTLPATALLTATVDDTATGGTNIGGANYTTPSGTSWPGIPMSASDGTFDEVAEDVEAAIAVPTVPGTYTYYVHAWDGVLNTNDTAPYATIIVADDLPPEISNVLIDGQTSVTYYLSSLPSTIDLTAFIDDTLTGGLLIGGANYTTPTATTWPGANMNATDGTFDEQSEAVVTTISTPATPGTYTYYIHAWDSGPSFNDTAPSATVIIIDDMAPQISLVRVDGQTSVTVNVGTVVTLTASTSDLARGGSDIAGANYTVGLAQWPGTNMTAVDGAFDSPQEDVTIPVDTAGWAVGAHQVCVYARDTAQGYDDSVQACAQIDLVIDNEPPSISQVRAGGQTSVTVKPGTAVVLTATISDAASGGSNIAGANYTTGLGQWPGTSMAASDGAFNSQQETVSVTINTIGWTDGIHPLCVYGWDSAGFHNTTAQQCADIVIDGTPPSISQVFATPDPQETGKTVLISATVTDPGGVSAVGVEVRDPSGTLLGNYSMVYNSGTLKYEYSGTYTTAGAYTFSIWARDVVGNYAHSPGDYDITLPAQPPTPQPSFIEQYWWALLIVIIAVVALLAFMLMRKKRPGPVTEEEQAPPTELSPEEIPQHEASPSPPPAPPTPPPPGPPSQQPPP